MFGVGASAEIEWNRDFDSEWKQSQPNGMHYIACFAHVASPLPSVKCTQPRRNLPRGTLLAAIRRRERGRPWQLQV